MVRVRHSLIRDESANFRPIFIPIPQKQLQKGREGRGGGAAAAVNIPQIMPSLPSVVVRSPFNKAGGLSVRQCGRCGGHTTFRLLQPPLDRSPRSFVWSVRWFAASASVRRFILSVDLALGNHRWPSRPPLAAARAVTVRASSSFARSSPLPRCDGGGHSIAADCRARPIDKEEDARGDSRQKEERTEGRREGRTDDL